MRDSMGRFICDFAGNLGICPITNNTSILKLVGAQAPTNIWRF